jgi:nucleotide-binding universal stress UspA family protein
VIVRYSSVPVLVVGHSVIKRVRSILAPVNFKPYSEGGLLIAAKAAKALGSRLSILHVLNAPLYGDPTAMEGPKHLLEGVIAGLPADLRQACRPKGKLAFGRPFEEIVAAAEDEDIVVLAARRQGLLRDAVLGTTAERVLRHCQKPVLAVPVEGGRRRS